MSASAMLERLFAAHPKPDRPAWLERKIAEGRGRR